MVETNNKNKDTKKISNKEDNISHYKGKFQDSMYVKPSKPPKQKEPSTKK